MTSSTLHHRSQFLLRALLCFGFTLTSAASAQEATAASTADANRPRVLYRQAETAFNAGNFEQARTLLLEAWQIKQSYDVAASLGQTELELKLYRDAAEHLDYAVEHFAPMENEGVLEGVKSDLRTAQSQVAQARITVSEPRASISVNGRPLGESPLPRSVYLDPGTYDLLATLGDARKANRRLSLQKGGTYDVALSLPPASSLGPGVDEHSSNSDRDRPNWIPTYVTGGLAIVALGVGTGFAIDALSAKSQGEDKLKEAEGEFGTDDTCAPGNGGGSALCNDVKDLQDRRKSSNTVATVSFVVGGVMAAASVGSYFLWARPAKRDRTQVSASIGSGGGSLLIQGSF